MFFKLQNTVFLNEQVHLSYRFFLKYSKLNSMSIAKVKLFVCVLLYITMTNFIYSQSVKVSRYGFQINQSKALRDAFNSSFDTLVIDKQDRPWVIDPMRFIDVRNKVIIFEEGVEVLAKKNAFSKKGDALLSFRNCQNIQLLGNGAKLKMNKIEYTDGEWRHGISLWNCRDIYIERSDFMEDPPKKFFRLGPGREVRLRYAYFITCTDVIKDENEEVVELRCTYDPETKGGSAPDGRRVKGTIHWVSAEHAIQAEIHLYDRLFNHPNPSGDKNAKDFKEYINTESLIINNKSFLEPSLGNAKPEDRFQFERIGYFCVDSHKSDSDNLIFNRTVTLRDTWSKIQKTQNKK